MSDPQTEKHVYESNFEPEVANYFRQQHEVISVETQVWQPEPEWYVDIVVRYPWATLYIEVENDENAIRAGMKQAEGYAAADPRAGVPMVVTPPDHLQDHKLSRLAQSGTTIVREFDAVKGEFV